ncbi:hypothetical protein PCC9214_02396 [Planktothrix tepida]|uniref:Uncharacterized protein n=1 Tax=Planktothrix tepida PCC 9214 TaxID=671072 RepID=A0A1J1LHF8_9CYAN|nr:hypothetical protein [Planktothrix tepida]CAD5948471.1 hypothetical protein PCC9214_02396 [Planktothrix tepida]CUR31915.1 hypothetical protein PL921430054 [Planktothrix tepida PCC 9214]
MNNQGKLQILYFALEDVVSSICSLKDCYYSFDYNCENLLSELIKEGENAYQNNITLIPTKRVIEGYMGKLETEYLDIIYLLWFALSFGLAKYFSIKAKKPNLLQEIDDRLRLAYHKYSSEKSPETWEKIYSIVKFNLHKD